MKRVELLDRIIEMCAELRGVKGLSWKTIIEFGAFLIDMANFLVYDEYSKDRTLARFQAMLRGIKDKYIDLYNPADIDTYIKLFEFYCIWAYRFYIPFKLKEYDEKWKYEKLGTLIIPEWLFSEGGMPSGEVGG